MQIICATQQAASYVLLLFMTAQLGPIDIYTFSQKETRSPRFTITLRQPLDATLRTTIEGIPDIQIIGD